MLSKLFTVSLVTLCFSLSGAAQANSTATKAKNSVKRTARKVDEKFCEMVNGKLECLAKKAKHRAQNAGDKFGEEAERLKEKVDENTDD